MATLRTLLLDRLRAPLSRGSAIFADVGATAVRAGAAGVHWRTARADVARRAGTRQPTPDDVERSDVDRHSTGAPTRHGHADLHQQHPGFFSRVRRRCALWAG